MPQLNWLEVWGFVTGAACVWLAVRQNIWNWPIGIANNIFYLIVFWHSKLYADGGLQVVYILISAYGWWSWLYGGENRHELKVNNVSKSHAVIVLIATALSAIALYGVLKAYTDSSVPWGDATTTALSLAAQYMMSRKMLENWPVWITADVLYIALYAYKHLYLTSVLYLVFLIMCVIGFTQWRTELQAQPRTA